MCGHIWPEQHAQGNGKSGIAFKELLRPLSALPFEARPVIINSESVARLVERRKVNAGLRAGTEHIDEELDEGVLRSIASGTATSLRIATV